MVTEHISGPRIWPRVGSIRMVNYSWGDVWDERQKRDDIDRYYGKYGGYSSGSPSINGDSSYSRRPHNRTHRGRNFTIFFVILLGGASLAYVFNAFDIQRYAESLVGSASNDAPIPAANQSSDRTSTDHSSSINRVEYVTEPETKVLLDRGALLINGGNSAAFDIQVPNKEVKEMIGEIVVDGSSFVHVEFTDAQGQPFCSSCEYDVYSSTPTAVKIAVNSGDSLMVKVTNPVDADLQTVNLKLSVTYLEQKEKITYQSIEQEPQSTPPTAPSSLDDRATDSTPIETKTNPTYDDMRCFTHRGLTSIVYVEIPIRMCDNIGRTQNSYLAMAELNWLRENLREGDSIELLDDSKTYDDMRCFTHQGLSPMTYVEIPMGMCDYRSGTQNSYIATIELNWLIENLPEGDSIKLLSGEIIRG